MNKTIKTVKTNSKNTKKTNNGSKLSNLIDSRTKDGYPTLSSKSYCDFICSLSYDELRRI